MKKRSMLAIASLATGFVVAAITPSHVVAGQDVDGAKELHVGDLPGAVEEADGHDGLARPGGTTWHEGRGFHRTGSPYNG